jgi:hypothetical protein
MKEVTAMILSFKVQNPASIAALYATEDKVYFQGDKWTEDRSKARNFANIGELLQAVSEFTVESGTMPENDLHCYAIAETA